MKRLVVLIVLFALSAGQALQVPSSFKDGVKWEFGIDTFHGDISDRSNVNIVNQAPVVPTVYKKELVAPIVRREPIAAAAYKNPPVIPDVYKNPVSAVYKKEPVVHSAHRQQSVIPETFKAPSVASNIYKSQPVVHNIVHKQQAAVPIVHETYPVVSNVDQFRNQPVQTVVHLHESTPLQKYVPRVLPVNSQEKVQTYTRKYPHHALVHSDVQVIPHN